MAEADVESQLDPVYHAMSLLRRRRYDEAIEVCTRLLAENPYDKAVWFLKTRALTLADYVDDTELVEEGVAEMLMDDNAVASVPRPGTSLTRPQTNAGGGASQIMRPMSSSGRPLTGFARPGTGSRGAGGNMSMEQALKSGGRAGTARPVTALGRQVRLGTASMLSDRGGPFINADKLPLAKYAVRPSLSKVLCDYLLYVDHNPKRALELAAEATKVNQYKDWWWKARLGKCYYQLGLYRDAEKQYLSSLKEQDMVVTHLELAKVYLKLDQPLKALEIYKKAQAKHPGDTSILLNIARVYDMLNDTQKAAEYFKKVLHFDASCVEAIACMAAHHFYNDQPEVALRFYRRLVQMGVDNTELWCNLGLCCLYAAQYDMTLSCFDRALSLADDSNMADVWYNVGIMGISIGDLGLAYQAFKIAISVDNDHAESYTNLGVLELRKGNVDAARISFDTARRLAPHSFESFFNGALMSYKLGDFQDSFKLTAESLGLFPDHSDSKDLLEQLQRHFTTL
jgi:tetratricopeptide repeat protein 8